MLTLQLLWSNRTKVLLLALLGSCTLSWHLQSKNGELRGQLNAKPLVSERKDIKTTKGSIKVIKTIIEKEGEKTTQTITERAPTTTETSLSHNEVVSCPIKNENRRLVGVSLDPLNKTIAIGRIGYSFSNRLDLTYGYVIKETKHLLEVTLRF